MSTSDRALVLEAAAAAALAVAAVVALSPGDLWLEGGGAHPAWIAVLVLAARYGLRGLFAGLAATWGGLAAMNLALSGQWAGLSLRSDGAADVFALVATVLVAWIAEAHGRKNRRLAQRLAECDGLRSAGEETISAMQEAIAVLRGRQDRIDVSLSLWRELAGRLERGDAPEAARAALELCAIRCGAAAGIVHAWDGVHLHPIAWRGQWSAAQPRPRDIVQDRTAMAAVQTGRPVRRIDGAGPEDADVAVPIVNDAGTIVGVIAQRGPAPEKLRAAEVSDLLVAARWLAAALSRPHQPSAHNLLPVAARRATPAP